MPRRGVGAPSGLERRVAGPQLFLLARGEQQRVVDAGAEPEHAAQGRSEPGHVGRGGGPHQRAEAEPDAGEGRADGVARGAQVAQHGDQQQDGDGEADHLPDRETARRGSVDRLAGHGDVDAGSLEAGGGLLEAVPGCRAEIGRGLVVADRGEGGAAVLGQPAGSVEGILDGADVRLPPDLGQRCLDGVLGHALVGAEDHDGLRARLGLEALLEEVLGLLGLDARDGEVVLEAAAGGDGSADHRGHGEQHGEGGGTRAAADEGCDVGEESAHGR